MLSKEKVLMSRSVKIVASFSDYIENGTMKIMVLRGKSRFGAFDIENFKDNLIERMGL